MATSLREPTIIQLNASRRLAEKLIENGFTCCTYRRGQECFACPGAGKIMDDKHLRCGNNVTVEKGKQGPTLMTVSAAKRCQKKTSHRASAD